MAAVKPLVLNAVSRVHQNTQTRRIAICWRVPIRECTRSPLHHPAQASTRSSQAVGSFKIALKPIRLTSDHTTKQLNSPSGQMTGCFCNDTGGQRDRVRTLPQCGRKRIAPLAVCSSVLVRTDVRLPAAPTKGESQAIANLSSQRFSRTRTLATFNRAMSREGRHFQGDDTWFVSEVAKASVDGRHGGSLPVPTFGYHSTDDFGSDCVWNACLPSMDTVQSADMLSHLELNMRLTWSAQRGLGDDARTAEPTSRNLFRKSSESQRRKVRVAVLGQWLGNVEVPNGRSHPRKRAHVEA